MEVPNKSTIHLIPSDVENLNNQCKYSPSYESDCRNVVDIAIFVFLALLCRKKKLGHGVYSFLYPT
tara:strand:+ start:1122 stop:1319 length:198 start_codon:yes stop_codon:yes gene_type:complete